MRNVYFASIDFLKRRFQSGVSVRSREETGFVISGYLGGISADQLEADWGQSSEPNYNTGDVDLTEEVRNAARR